MGVRYNVAQSGMACRVDIHLRLVTGQIEKPFQPTIWPCRLADLQRGCWLLARVLSSSPMVTLCCSLSLWLVVDAVLSHTVTQMIQAGRQYALLLRISAPACQRVRFES